MCLAAARCHYERTCRRRPHSGCQKTGKKKASARNRHTGISLTCCHRHGARGEGHHTAHNSSAWCACTHSPRTKRRTTVLYALRTVSVDYSSIRLGAGSGVCPWTSMEYGTRITAWDPVTSRPCTVCRRVCAMRSLRCLHTSHNDDRGMDDGSKMYCKYPSVRVRCRRFNQTLYRVQQ